MIELWRLSSVIIKCAYETGKDDSDKDDGVHEDNMQALKELLEGVIL